MNRVLKRLIDAVCALVGLVLVAPVLILVAFAIRVTMGPPVLFRQVRPGKHCRLFTLFKFRTMRGATCPDGGSLLDQERLTPMGAFLRRTSIDELPQLWNVLIGDLSLVGPRPLLVEYLDRYTPQQARRHEVRPGITGWAQVNGRNALSWEDKFALDVWYVDNWNLWLDGKILWMTLIKVLKREGIQAPNHATMPPFTGKPESTMSSSENTPVVVFGAGGHAKVVVSTLQQSGCHVEKIYDDDPATMGRTVSDVNVAGPTSEATSNLPTVIAIGDNAARERLASQQSARQWVTAIHPSAQVHPSARIGSGTVILAGAVIQADAIIGAHAIINTGATVDHDCVVEDFAHIGPGAHLAGGVRIGRGAFLGVGSAVVPGVRIGEWSTVGAGGVATSDLADHIIAVGVPAKPIRAVAHGVQTGGPGSTSLPTNSGASTEQSVEFPLFSPWPSFDEEQIEAAITVLRSGKVNYWTGEEGRQFEAEFAAFTGCQYSVALANGTLALELALYALEIGPGDEVIVPSRTFIASASCVVARGATPVIADVDPVSQNLTSETVRAVISPRTKAIIAVHLAGWPCDMDPLMDLARQHSLKVIEDCAQAVGATYQGRSVGSLGDVAAFSFCQDKIITTGGEGGMLTTNDESLWKRAWSFKDHGKSWDAVHHREHSGVFKWLHESFGSNYRMTEMQAAIGRVALRKLPAWIDQRRKNAELLTESFAVIPALRLTLPPATIGHGYYKYYAFVRPERLLGGWDRDRIVRALQKQGVPCGSGSCSEIYLEMAFQHAQLGPSQRLPVAQELGDNSLMFLVHPTLSHEAIQATCNAVTNVFTAASEWKSTTGPANPRTRRDEYSSAHLGG
jgi:sugar O-acyltransferase (sialic acid O-acetyltransferase NeuD family)